MQASMVAWVVTYLLHSTILVLGAWLLERRWSDRPERMSAVWKTALVGGLLTATVQTGLGIAPMAGRWDLAPEPSASVEAPVAVASAPVLAGGRVDTGEPSWPPPAGEAQARAERAAAEVAAVVVSPAPSWPPPDAALVERPLVTERALVEDPEATMAMATVEPVVEREHASVSSVPSSSSPGWTAIVPWVMAILVGGALLGLASVAVAFAALRRQLAGRRTPANGPLLTLLEGLRRRAGIVRPVRLTVAPRVQVPMAVGVLRPEIVVPIKAAQVLPPAHQESLLAHELAHVLRHDPAWRLVALLVERVFFFQPLNRLASRRVAQSAEYLCDDWAARHTRQPLALASCLTEIATWVARTGPVPATMAGPRSILGRRVQRLLQPARASARPWWLSAALGLPLLAVVAVAPGVGAHAKGDAKRRAPEQVVVIDEEGRRHEVRPPEHGTIVVQQRDGELVVRRLDDGAAAAVVAAEDGGSRRDARKTAREQERARDRARRQARKDLRRAFRAAKARGDAAPSRAEVEAILRQARVADGSYPEHVEVHVVVPGELELHGRVPVDVEAIEDGIEEGVEDAMRELERLDLEGLRALEGLEGIEQLGPLLEELEEELEAEGLDVVMRRHPGATHPEVHIELSPEQRQALREAERMRAAAERAREGAERAREDAVREQLRHRRTHASDVEREAARLEREAEALRRAIERAQRDRDAMPTVWAPAPAPVPMPPAMYDEPPAAPPAPPRVRRVRGVAPKAPRGPRPPVAPMPPMPPAAPEAPQPDVGPVVWVSWASPIHG